MQDPNVVNDKKLLLRNVWMRFGWDDSKGLMRNLESMPMAWSIDRALRELRKEGKIKLSEEAEEERYQQYKEKREEYGKALENMFGIEIDPETNTVRFL
jgi:hypothetical protein